MFSNEFPNSYSRKECFLKSNPFGESFTWNKEMEVSELKSWYLANVINIL